MINIVDDVCIYEEKIKFIKEKAEKMEDKKEGDEFYK